MSKNKKAKATQKKAIKVKKPVKKVSKPVANKGVAKKSAPSTGKKPVAVKKTVNKKTAPAKAKAPAPKKAVKPVAKAKKSPAAPKVKAKIVKTPVKKAAPAKPVAKPNKLAPPVKKAEHKPQAPAKNEKTAKAQPVAENTVKKNEETLSKKQVAEKKAGEVLAISNTIPVATKEVISPSRIASISHSITNPVKRPDSYSVRAEKEPAGKFEMEFVAHASAEMLYEFLSTPSGLSEWFCDDLNIRNGIYTFIWEDTMQQARLLKTVELQLVRFQWVDKTDGSYFEFRIQRDDLTNDISIIITDFAESVSERESAKLLWNNQIEKLMHVIGSVF